MGSIANLDALVEHRRDKTITVLYREWPLPVEMPHRAILYLDALQGQHGAEYRLSYTETVLLARLIFNEETVAAWQEGGVGPDRLPGLVEETVAFLTPRQIAPIRKEEDDAQGGSPP